MISAVARPKNGDANTTIIIHLDNPRFLKIPVKEAYVVFDKCNLTGAGVIEQKFKVVNHQIIITGIPKGKYFVDVITSGSYRQHYTAIMKATRKTEEYTLKPR